MTCLLCGTRGVVYLYLVYNQENEKDGMTPVGSSFVKAMIDVYVGTKLLGRCQSVDVLILCSR